MSTTLHNPISQDSIEQAVHIPAGEITLEGNFSFPAGAKGVVLFAHGSGSSRFSPRNRFVAQALNDTGLATLLIDLLSPTEEAIDSRTGSLRFDIRLLAKRVVAAIDWLGQNGQTRDIAVGCFGASTGAAAALVAASERPAHVRAVVSRGGRPDLAGAALWEIEAPTLLIVGGEDTPVIAMNREAMEQLPGEKEMVIVPGATHLFEEPGALEEVARLAAGWFERYLY